MPTSGLIYVVSDATAETAQRLLQSALIQYSTIQPEVRIFSLVRQPDRLVDIVAMAAQANALIVYTIAAPDNRRALEDAARTHQVTTFDLIGPLMEELAKFLDAEPTGQPGIPRLTDDYFQRIEAVEFTIRHDDGQAIGTVDQADLVLVGLSRTSKTPLSTYLAQKGWKVANVPIVLGLPLPRELQHMDQAKVYGLTIDVASLIRIRRSRLKSLNMPMDTDYARRDHIIRELKYARELFQTHPDWPVLDVSQKAVEESAAIVLRRVEERTRGARLSRGDIGAEEGG